MRLGVGWFAGVITRRVHQKPRHDYDNRVMLQADGSTRSIKLSLELYRTDKGAGAGAWVLPELGSREGVRRSGRAVSLNVRN